MGCGGGRRGFFYGGRGCGRGYFAPGCLTYIVGVILLTVVVFNLIF